MINRNAKGKRNWILTTDSSKVWEHQNSTGRRNESENATDLGGMSKTSPRSAKFRANYYMKEYKLDHGNS